MSVNDAVNTPAIDAAQGEQDLGPLAWVFDELGKSLDGAVKALRRFVHDAELARESDLAALDVGPLRIARQQLHQASGALEMVGMGSPALVLRAMEAAVQKFVQRPELCTDDAAGALERASFALSEYLESVLAGKPVSPVTLFPQYRDVQALTGAARVHPADLWPAERRFREPELALTVAPMAYGPPARARLDQAVLKIVKEGDLGAARDLRDASLGFAAAPDERQARAFWKICAGFFEAFSLGLFTPDVYVKRVASRILMQYATLAKGDSSIADRLVQDLLFFCSQARVALPGQAPALEAVHNAFALDRFVPVDYEARRFGRFDPAVLAQARKRIAAAAETWSALAGGDRNKFKPAADQFSLVCDSLRKLHRHHSESLVQALTSAVDRTVSSGQIPSAALAMEVATSVLYLQAALEELDTSDEQMVERAHRLAGRLQRVCAGAEPEPLELWMEDLYRRVSDHQTMGSVVGELRATLGEAERAMDQFFRSPENTAPLGGVPGYLAQMRGVLSVLGLDHASLAVVRMRDTVERLLVDPTGGQGERSQVFEKLGSNLGALGFLIDMLSYQPALARKLFIYDEELGELRVLMGRSKMRATDDGQIRPQVLQERGPVPLPEVVPRTFVAAAPAALVDAAAAVPALSEDTPTAQSALAESSLLPLEFIEPQLATSEAELQHLAPGLELDFAVDFVDTQPSPDADALLLVMAAAPSPAPAQPAESLIDDELMQVFLEEVREVVANGLAAIELLTAEPGALSEQTTLRRAFHTLKGSSRMVGLNDFGEAAWSMEQLLNAWLAEQKPVQLPLLQLTQQALQGFARWAEDIGAGDASVWQVAAFSRAAEAMRDGHTLPLSLPPEQGAATFAPAPALDALHAEPAAEQHLWDIDLTSSEASAADAVDEPLLDLDFLDLALPSAADGAVVLSDGPAEPAMGQEIDFSEFSAALATQEPGQPELEPAQPAAQAQEPELAQEPEQSEPPDVLPSNVLDLPVFDLTFPPSTAPEMLQTEPLSTERALDEAALAPPDAAEKVTVSLQEQEQEQSALQEVLPPYDLQLPVFDLTFPPLTAPEMLPAETLATTALASDEAALAPVDVPEEVTVSLQEQGVTLDTTAAEAVTVQAPAASADDGLLAVDLDPDEDAIKFIGSLRIGLPLYNVYLNEADEWSRRLVTSLQEWSLELHQPLPDMAVALAHSLAGSSATVGFEALSDTARLLEHALSHVQIQPHGLPEQATVFVAASEDMRRLLHQFAAGFLKEPNLLVHDQLRLILQTDVANTLTPPLDYGEEFLPESVDVEALVPQVDADDSVFPDMPEPVETATRDAVAPPLSVVTAWQGRQHAAGEAIAAAQAADIDDDIDVLDVIDPDLFQFFEEEALELLPGLGGALRQWAARPSNLGARSEVLRVLHTLKGSARLAGAMRLGEMSHRLESAIEQLDVETVQAAHIEPLLGSFDGLQANFDALRNLSAQAPAELIALPGHEESLPSTPVVAPAPVALARPQGALTLAPLRASANQSVRVRAQLLDRLVNQAGEVMITRSRLQSHLGQLKGSMTDLSGNLDRLRQQLRDIEMQSESQMQSRLALSKDSAAGFDPLEFDRFTRVQELTRMMAESVNDVATVQRNLQRAIDSSEDDLIAQGRQARELQRDLLRTRMVEFEGISERLYAVVRQSSKEGGKQIKLDITGGSIEMDRGVLDRMTPAFEHLLRNCVAHGIEAPQDRTAAGKAAIGTITVNLRHEGNDVSVEFRDDGAGLNLERIRAKALSLGLITADVEVTDVDAANLIFMPGFTTASEVTEISGRGIGMDVVRSEINALGGRIETTTRPGQGTAFRMVLPLTTAVTQVVMLRSGSLAMGVPANLIEIVRRVPVADMQAAYRSGEFEVGGERVPFYWSGALLQASAASSDVVGKTQPVVVFRSASQRIAMHVDEVLGNQEVVVKNLGPQLSRLPGLAGMSVLASGAVVLIYNPVALSTVYGEQVRAAHSAKQAVNAAALQAQAIAGAPSAASNRMVPGQVPLILVVDDSITVRRVTQRLLQREGYRVALAADGLQALERLQDERPTVVLSDIEMPRMDGFDLARNIRADAELADLPIIMITSRIAQKHREHAMELGVNHYLGKPYSDEELLSLVQHYARLAAAAEVV